MSDVKFCDSCGASLSAVALFCHKCGQKQSVIEEKEISPTDDNYNSEQIIAASINTQPENVKNEDIENENAYSELQSFLTDKEDNEVENTDSSDKSEENVELDKDEDISNIGEPEKTIFTEPEPESEFEPEPEPVNTIADNINQEQKSDDSQSQVTYNQPQSQPIYQQPPVTQQAPYAQQASDTQQAPYYQQAPVAQQVPFAQEAPVNQQAPYIQLTPAAQQAPYAQQAAPVPAPKKKKFPWFFTVLWILMFAAVGIWGYFLLVDPNYNYPILTSEAQRYVIFTAAVAVIIYTFSLKLTMKKLKAIPTILLVVFSLAIFVLFCLIELQDGSFLHDMVSNMVESVLPAFGE